MRILLALLLATGALLVVGAGTAFAQSDDRGNACPPASKNPGGTPPDCGHPPPEEPAACVEEGPVSSVVDQVEQGIREGGGDAIANVLHTVNCEIIVPLENALGLGPQQQGL